MLAALQKMKEQEQREKEEEQRRREQEQWWSEQEEVEEEDQDQNLQTTMEQGTTVQMEQGTTAPMIQEENVQKQLKQARSNLNRVTEELKRSQTHIKETQRENIALYEKMKALLNDP